LVHALAALFTEVNFHHSGPSSREPVCLASQAGGLAGRGEANMLIAFNAALDRRPMSPGGYGPAKALAEMIREVI
jgi:hypothetical protein